MVLVSTTVCQRSGRDCPNAFQQKHFETWEKMQRYNAYVTPSIDASLSNTSAGEACRRPLAFCSDAVSKGVTAPKHRQDTGCQHARQNVQQAPLLGASQRAGERFR